jgi:hypothetical protein
MWFIRRILWCSSDDHDAVVLLQKVKKPLKTRNTDLLRAWYKNEYPEKPPKGLSKILGGLGRLRNWLDGRVTHWVEDIISNLRQKDSELYKNPLAQDTVVVRGWIPSLNPCIDYEFDLSKSDNSPAFILSAAGLSSDTPFYKINNVLFMVKRELTLIRLDSLIVYIASLHGNKRRKDRKLIRNSIREKFRKKVPWDQINVTNYRMWIKNRAPYMNVNAKNIFLKAFETYYDKPLWLCCIFQRAYAYVTQKSEERLSMYNTMISHPMASGLSSDDTDRLLIMLGRPIMSFKIKNEIEDADLFRKNVGNNTALLSTKFKTSSIIEQLPSGHLALKQDVLMENILFDWLKDVDVYNGMPTLQDFEKYDENTIVVVNNMDDIMAGYNSLSVEEIIYWKKADKESPYIVFAAHRLSIYSWINLKNYMSKPPVALIGRLDQYPVGRGQIYRDIGNAFGYKIRFKPTCSSVHIMSLMDFIKKNIKVEQIFYKGEDIKNRAILLGALEKCEKRLWLQHPKRLRTVKNITDKYIYLVDEEKPITLAHMDVEDGMFIKPWQSVNDIKSALVLCEKMSDFDIHCIQTCVKNDLYIVNLDSIPTLSGVSIDSMKSRVTVIGCKT